MNKALPCSWCKQLPYVDQYGYAECNTAFCQNEGYGCGDIEAWNQVMSGKCDEHGYALPAYARPCKSCGKQPYLTYHNNLFCMNNHCSNRNKLYSVEEWNGMNNNVVHPNHYNWLPEIECMDVVKHFNFIKGNVIKYVWRSGYKDSTTELEDLEKARYYLDIAIEDVKKCQQK